LDLFWNSWSGKTPSSRIHFSTIIPERHRAVRDEALTAQAAAWNQRIADAGLRIQNYDKGIERFVRKFDPDEELEAMISIAKGVHHDHGLAVYITQHKRRCLLLGTTYGLRDEEALWNALMSWANFQLRCERPRQTPG
jgi:hypothetical protein